MYDVLIKAAFEFVKHVSTEKFHNTEKFTRIITAGEFTISTYFKISAVDKISAFAKIQDYFNKFSKYVYKVTKIFKQTLFNIP